MPHLQWNEDYSVGVEVIDEQHKRLFEIGNQIHELLESYVLIDKYYRISEVLSELKEYTKYHFKTEEQFMRKINYPEYTKQVEEHNNFISEIEDAHLDMTLMSKDQDDYIKELLTFVFNWIAGHILKSDMGIKLHKH